MGTEHWIVAQQGLEPTHVPHAGKDRNSVTTSCSHLTESDARTQPHVPLLFLAPAGHIELEEDDVTVRNSVAGRGGGGEPRHRHRVGSPTTTTTIDRKKAVGTAPHATQHTPPSPYSPSKRHQTLSRERVDQGEVQHSKDQSNADSEGHVGVARSW
jgi:hypothetical protein